MSTASRTRDDSSSSSARYSFTKKKSFEPEVLDLIRRLDAAMEYLISIHPGMTLNQARTLLRIAIADGGFQADLVKALEMKESAVSRNLQYWLGRMDHKDAKVPEAIDIRSNNENRRINEIFLTNTGEHIINSLIKSFKGT